MSKYGNKIREAEFKEFLKVNKGSSYTETALKWFIQNLGEIVTSEELARIPGKDGKPISHNIRRIFELRDEKGYDIINHKDERKGYKLKVDQWVLLNSKPNAKKIRTRGITTKLRAEVLERDLYTCQTCGRTIGDNDPFNSSRKIKLHIGHIIAHKAKDGSISNVGKKLMKDDFITQCNVCNEGTKNKDVKIVSIIDRIIELSDKEQREIYNYLTEKFNRE